jgi:carboxypeptidase family protein
VNHLTDEQLTAYLDGAFKGRDAEEAGRHLATCQPCSEALAELAAQDASLKPALAHDPGEAYFERFAARVEQRIGAPGTSRARAAFDLGRWFGSPRALAWAGGVAVVIVGGGLALMTSRDGLLPGMRDRDLAARLERSAQSQEKQAPSPETRQAPPAAMDGGPALGPSGVETDVSSRATEREGAAALGTPDESPTPRPEMTKQDAVPPAERSRFFAPPPGDAKARADAPADPRLARPSRAYEVRRNEAGEEVPVGRRTVPAPSPVPPSGADQSTQVRKKLVAEPLDAVKKSAPSQMLGATSPLAESGAREGDGRLCGSVRDAANRPIAGAQVVLTDIGRTVTTDPTGRFCVSVPPGEHPLSVMAVGYRESRQTVRAEAGADIRVTLAAVSVLDERGMTLAGRAAPSPVKRALPTEPIGPPAMMSLPPDTTDFLLTLSDTLQRMIREARRLDSDAAARRTASRFELAAGAWSRLLPRLANGPLGSDTRRHVAESRYRAWELGPNPRRARAAVEALNAYVNDAPDGPERDQAIQRLNRVRP